jgi:transposase-like protein
LRKPLSRDLACDRAASAREENKILRLRTGNTYLTKQAALRNGVTDRQQYRCQHCNRNEEESIEHAFIHCVSHVAQRNRYLIRYWSRGDNDEEKLRKLFGNKMAFRDVCKFIRMSKIKV